jgi:hypothetical protein
MMLRSAGREGVADLMRAQVREKVVGLAAQLDGPDAELRAALVMALSFGMSAITSVAGVDAINDAPPELLRKYLAEAMGPLLEPASPAAEE